jgi:hypothetical protein
MLKIRRALRSVNPLSIRAATRSLRAAEQAWRLPIAEMGSITTPPRRGSRPTASLAAFQHADATFAAARYCPDRHALHPGRRSARFVPRRRPLIRSLDAA